MIWFCLLFLALTVQKKTQQLHCFVVLFQEIKWHKEWHPRIEFFNAVEISKMEHYRDLRYEHEENAIVVESYRIKGTFRQNLSLKNFPLDYQVW